MVVGGWRSKREQHADFLNRQCACLHCCGCALLKLVVAYNDPYNKHDCRCKALTRGEAWLAGRCMNGVSMDAYLEGSLAGRLLFKTVACPVR